MRQRNSPALMLAGGIRRRSLARRQAGRRLMLRYLTARVGHG
jgi:hypothetical protein